jgi:hypothetical protein
MAKVNDQNQIESSSKFSWKVRLTLAGVKFVSFLGFSLVTAHCLQIGFVAAKDKANQLHEAIRDKLTIVKYQREYKHADEADLDEIIKEVSREYQIDPLILQVIADKESSRGKELYRFEPKKYAERSSEDRQLGLSEDERRMENSSHGVFHIMGYTARSACKLHYSQLYDPWVSARCAATIVAKSWNNLSHVKDSAERLRQVFQRYNGAGPVSVAYSRDAMSRVAQIIYQDLGKRRG